MMEHAYAAHPCPREAASTWCTNSNTHKWSSSWRARSGPGRPTLHPAFPDASLLPADRDPDTEQTWTLRFSPSPPKSAGAPRAPDSPPPLTPGPAATFIPARALEGADPLPCCPQEPAPSRVPGSPSPAPTPAEGDPDPLAGRPRECAPPRASSSLNDVVLETLGHLGHIAAILGPLRDQLLTLNQHVEQLRGSFDQTVSLAVGFILGNASAERGLLLGQRE
ncbi:undifferentiated embryonic cell transcription factor 1 [Orycteropus afer afer]|uniref:Undifferentiated embryonic cell transcription factor 1 n=1 Tax=Orycteropus afer afer TaxID=1230840 RepID=A0A8B6ZH98_ORYAF|nr:undifferentiated embryonic cell transcription factor 1 [Orycteropus afer afer]